MNQQDPRTRILFTRSGLRDKPHRMFAASNLPELEEMEQTEEPALQGGVAVSVLVLVMSKSMKRFREEPAEQSALESGVAVTDFIEDIAAVGRRIPR